MTRPLRYGIIGGGVVGPTHAEAVAAASGAELVAVCDVNEERARALARPYAAQTDQDLRKFLDRDLDIVSLCIPSGYHAEVAISAMKAGKHVLTEKPLAISLASCDEMIATGRQLGRCLGSIYDKRFDPAVQWVKQSVSQHMLGTLIMGSAHINWYRSQAYYDSGAWSGTWALDGGGVLMNQGIHTIDLLQWVMGRVTDVCAATALRGHKDIEVEDTAVAVLRFESGALGLIQATTAAFPGYPERLEIYGSGGTAVLEGGDLKVWSRPSKSMAVGHYGGVLPNGSDFPHFDPMRRKHGHFVQIQDMIDAVQEGREPVVTGEEARKAVAIITAIYQSQRAQQWVKVPA